MLASPEKPAIWFLVCLGVFLVCLSSPRLAITQPLRVCYGQTVQLLALLVSLLLWSTIAVNFPFEIV